MATGLFVRLCRLAPAREALPAIEALLQRLDQPLTFLAVAAAKHADASSLVHLPLRNELLPPPAAACVLVTCSPQHLADAVRRPAACCG